MVTVDGGPVRPHVQAFADEINRLTGITHIITYEGHQPSRVQALDIFATYEQMDVIAQYYMEHWRHYGGDYIIRRQQIWNPEISPNWRDMADRGSRTANHYDHVHISFQATGAATPPDPSTQEDDMFNDNDRKTLADLQMVLLDPVHGIPKRLEQGEENDKATNAAVGRLEVSVRDQVTGLEAKMDRLIAKLGA